MAKKKGKPKGKTSSGPGRKLLWDVLDIPSKLDSIRGWAMNGSTDEELWTMIGIGRETFYKWKREKLEFMEAIKKGKEVSNGELLNSAFRQANGFTFVEQVPIKLKRTVYDEFTGKKLRDEEYVELVEVEKQAVPNPTMNIFMLKNRLPEQYKDKQEVTHNFNQKLEDLL